MYTEASGWTIQSPSTHFISSQQPRISVVTIGAAGLAPAPPTRYRRIVGEAPLRPSKPGKGPHVPDVCGSMSAIRKRVPFKHVLP
jgi:hypothetical protein